jgi:Na+/H+-dicarboxylate symporters
MGGKVWKKMRPYRLAIFILIGAAIGSIGGAIFGPKAVLVKPLGDIFLYLMFTIVVPIVLILVTSAVASIADLRKLGKLLGVMIGIFIGLGVVASLVMLAGVTIYPPAAGVSMELPSAPEIKPFSTMDMVIEAFFVPDFVDIFSKGHILPAIIFCILLGIAISMVGERAKPIVDLLSRLSDVMIKLVGIIMWYAPIGIGAYFAYLVGDFGPSLLGSYARSMALFYPLTFVYWVIIYSITAWFSGGNVPFKRWWKNIPLPAVTAFGTCSSTATIPVNLDAAKKIGIPKYIRELFLPIGAAIHMDGSCLSGILKIAFAFGLLSIPFTPSGIGIAILVAVLSGVVLSGIPMGGYLGAMLIVSVYGFPPEILPLIMMIGTLVDPLATMVNATGDTNAGMIAARVLEGKNWYAKAID